MRKREGPYQAYGLALASSGLTIQAGRDKNQELCFHVVKVF
jgi:hypothetical protein